MKLINVVILKYYIKLIILIASCIGLNFTVLLVEGTVD